MPAVTDAASSNSSSNNSSGPSGATLDRLQAMVNGVLTQTGRYIKEAKGGSGAGRAQFSLKHSVPAALGRFHDSLDDLENELHQAQAALRRDLASLQAHRRKREQAEAAERRRLAIESSAKNTLSTEKEKPDAIMTDIAMPQSSVQPGNPTADSTMDMDHSSSALNQSAPPSATTAPPRDPLFDATPTTANAQDTAFDFDAMFADHDFATGPQTSSHGTKEHHHDNMDTTLPNLEFKPDEDNTGSSLLPGLEDFANSTNGLATAPHASKGLGNASKVSPSDTLASTRPNISQNSNQQATEFGSTRQQQQPNPADGAQASVQPNLLDTAPDTSLDDLFNLDYGDPVEGTEFEDAFFQYGES